MSLILFVNTSIFSMLRYFVARRDGAMQQNKMFNPFNRNTVLILQSEHERQQVVLLVSAKVFHDAVVINTIDRFVRN